MLKIGDRIKDYVIAEIGFDTFTEKRELTLVSVRPAIIEKWNPQQNIMELITIDKTVKIFEDDLEELVLRGEIEK